MTERSTPDLHEAVQSRLRADGQRYTAGRRALVEVLWATDRPLTIAELLEREAVPQSSAYRNLGVLEQAGVVHRVISSDDYARYELDDDLTDHHHHHLICSRCGAVADFTVAPTLEQALERTMATVAAATGFVPEQHRLDFVGLCAGCSGSARGA